MPKMIGSCLCGQVRFQTNAAPEGIGCCHCAQCRKQSGHIWASAHVPDGELFVEGDVRWFQSSPKAKRGFCPTCGSFLFWKHLDDDHTSFALGALDNDGALALQRHIFTAEKGDYYDITDGLPQS